MAEMYPEESVTTETLSHAGDGILSAELHGLGCRVCVVGWGSVSVKVISHG